MSDLKVLNEKALTLAELKGRLESIEKRDKDLSFRANKTKEYLNNFSSKKLKDVDALKKKIEDLNVPRLKDRHIAKIIDIAPKDTDSLKLLLSGEAITLKEEDIKKIVSLL